MKGRNAIVTGAAAAAATAAVLLGATPAAAATTKAGEQGLAFSIEQIAVPLSHAAVVSPDWKSCCNLFSC